MDQREGTDVRALIERVERLEAEVAMLRARRPPEIDLVPRDAGGVATDQSEKSLSRRQVLGRSAAVAAGAVSGGAALVGLSADPAAALPGTFTGTPAVSAYSAGGLAVDADADAASPLTMYVGAIGTDSTALRAQSLNGYGIKSFGTVGAELSGGRAQMKLVKIAGNDPPYTSGKSYLTGEVLYDNTDELWLCVAGGTPGYWRNLGGLSTAGALHMLNLPVRVFDTRAGLNPLSTSPKTQFNNEERIIDCKANGSGLPLQCRGVVVNFAVTNTGSGGFGNLFRYGLLWPGTASINWGQSLLTLSNMAIVACDTQARIKCKIAGTADVVIDVVGYFQ